MFTFVFDDSFNSRCNGVVFAYGDVVLGVPFEPALPDDDVSGVYVLVTVFFETEGLSPGILGVAGRTGLHFGGKISDKTLGPDFARTKADLA